MEVKDKKKHILKSAEKLFAVKGFEASTVRDIADDAGVNLAMISYYFGSKEKMMESLFQERMNNTKLKVQQILSNEHISTFGKVEVMLDEYIKKVIENESFYKILLCEQVMKKNPEIIRMLRELKMDYAAMFTELVKEGQKKKVFKKNIDVVLALNTMTGTVTQIIINKEHYCEFNNIEILQEEELKNFLHSKLFDHLKNIFKTILGYES
jgi:AcrR family transcriptional regulator